MSIRERIKNLFRREQHETITSAYNKWSDQYDDQPGNLVIDLDEEIFSSLLKDVDLRGKSIVDIGCGTGRHWNKLIKSEPSRIVGYDTSPNMLAKLKQKFQKAEVYKPEGFRLTELNDVSCDILVSTLTLAHIPEVEKVLKEWARVLKPGGEIIYTDYHPESLAKGGKRTFHHDGRTIEVKSFVYPIDEIRNVLFKNGFQEVKFLERVVDEKVKKYYDQQNAIELYNKFKGIPIIYGIHLKKE